MTSQPVLYLSHGAPPLADDPCGRASSRSGPAAARQAGQHPRRLRPLGGGPAGAVVHDRRAALLRLLGLPAEVLRRHLCGAGRRRACRPGGGDRGRARPAGAPGREPRAGPRRLRAARRDVPRRRRARPPDVDAHPRPASAVPAGPEDRAAARRRNPDHRVRVHHPQPARVQPGEARRRSAARLVGGVRRLGQGGDGRTRTSTPCSTSSTRRRQRGSPTRGPSTSLRCSSRWAPPTAPTAAASTAGASSTDSGSASRSGPGSSAEPQPSHQDALLSGLRQQVLHRSAHHGVPCQRASRCPRPRSP